MELETLKAYIKTHLKTRFIWPFKFPVGAFILFDKKLDYSIRLCIDYQGLNKLTIKNQYLLLLIRKVLNYLGWVKRFIQLDLTSAHHQIKIQERDEWKMVFCIRYGHFEYQVMPFGLFNTAVSF